MQNRMENLLMREKYKQKRRIPGEIHKGHKRKLK